MTHPRHLSPPPPTNKFHNPCPPDHVIPLPHPRRPARPQQDASSSSHLERSTRQQHSSQVIQRHDDEEHPGRPLRHVCEDVSDADAHPHSVALLEEKRHWHEEQRQYTYYLQARQEGKQVQAA
jgi:hypothetical protein